MVRATLGVRGVAYSTILALDRKIRDHQVLKIPANGAGGVNELGAATIPLTLQRFMLKAQGEMSEWISSFPLYTRSDLHCFTALL